MFYKSKYFRLSILIIIIQQLLLAGSTYFIAEAGRSVGLGNPEEGLDYIVLFFVAAIMSYVISSFNEIVCNRLMNISWMNYVESSISQLGVDQSISTPENKRSIVNWLSTEAMETYRDITEFNIDLFSLYLNIISTLFVFGITIGWKITIVMGTSILISLVIVTVLSGRISTLASSMQDRKQDTIKNLDKLWDMLFNGSTSTFVKEKSIFSNSAKRYFSETERYTILEQIIATAPILLSIPILVYFTLNYIGNSPEVIGVLVAVLPRSLQLYGNVHALSGMNSRVLLIRYRYKNLLEYVSKIIRKNLSTLVKYDEISVHSYSSNNNISATELMSRIKSGDINTGRYLITGRNGVGKSALLKMLKMFREDSIYLCPNVDIIGYGNSGSTGQKRIKEIEFACGQNISLLLMDEWDANLDNINTRDIDNKIIDISKNTVVVEVRHSN